MHQRTWLSLMTLPLVGTFTYPLLIQPGQAPRVESKAVVQDPLAGLSDIQDVMALVRDSYVDPPDMDKMTTGGIQGALERVHPLNAYLTAEDLRLPDPGPAETGLRVIKRGIVAQVVGVVPGSPAAKAGMEVGDVIRKLDGHGLGALSAWGLERSLRGPEGSELTVLRFANSNAQVGKVVMKRERLTRVSIEVRKDPKATLVSVPDLEEGRGAELRILLSQVDPKLPVVLDLRFCFSGTLLEASRVAALFIPQGAPLVTVQEIGQPDRAIPLEKGAPLALSKVVFLQGPGTAGAAEVLAAALRKAGQTSLGDRTAGLGVERSRIPLRQGGAVELVTRRWVGAGGEKLDRQGAVPEIRLRTLRDSKEDPLPKVLEALERPPVTTPKPSTSARLKPTSSLVAPPPVWEVA